jgi:hypothetical protein
MIISPSLKALLTGIVDYAGLFPPATLSLSDAMATYDQACRTDDRWMLGQFVLPAARLAEFETLLPQFSLPQWSLSLVVSGDPNTALEQLQSYRRAAIAISALEFAPLPVGAIADILPHIPAGVDAFFEIPVNADLPAYLSVLRGSGAAAKIRTGGSTAEAFPTVLQLGQFLVACANATVPLKATAGLHHPIRASYRLTYEPDSLSAVMHGFLNLAIAAALVYWKKLTPQEVLAVLEEPCSSKFQFHTDGITWAGHGLAIAEIAKARQQFFRSFGSCSFQEPVNDLETIRASLA